MQHDDMENNMADLPNVNHEQIAEFKRIAASDNDTSVLMLNLNRYTPDASYPDGDFVQRVYGCSLCFA